MAPDDHQSTPAPEAVDVDALLAERDALRAQLQAVRHGRRFSTHVRRTVAVLLVVLFAVSFFAAGVGAWLHRSTLNEDVWQERVVPLGREPAVQQVLATWTTDQLMVTVDPEALFEQVLPERGRFLAVPLSSAVREFVSDKVDEFFASERFEELWTVAATRAHEEAVAILRDERPNLVAGDETVTINLIPVIDEVLAGLLDAAPGLIGSDATLPEVSVNDLPDEARQRIATALGVELDDDFGTVTVYDGGKLSSAQQVVRLFDRLVIFTAVLTVVLFGAAMWVSPRRRRTLLQLLGAAALACILVRRLSFMLQEEVTTLIQVDENRDAATVVLSALVDPLTNAAATALWVIAAIALVTVITAPYPWVVRLRRTVASGTRSLTGAVSAVEGRARDLSTAQWVAGHADPLRIAGYVAGAVVLWLADLTWLTVLLITVLVVGWQVLVTQFVGRVERAATQAGP